MAGAEELMADSSCVWNPHEPQPSPRSVSQLQLYQSTITAIHTTWDHKTHFADTALIGISAISFSTFTTGLGTFVSPYLHQLRGWYWFRVRESGWITSPNLHHSTDKGFNHWQGLNHCSVCTVLTTTKGFISVHHILSWTTVCADSQRGYTCMQSPEMETSSNHSVCAAYARTSACLVPKMWDVESGERSPVWALLSPQLIWASLQRDDFIYLFIITFSGFILCDHGIV